MNILFTCVGRRNYLVSYFKEALCGSGVIVGADANELASGLAECDKKKIVPPVNSPEYIPSILNICREEKIGLLCSLNDLDLPVLSKNLDKFKEVGTIVSVSSPEVIDICFDKVSTAEFVESIGLNAPLTYTNLDAALGALKSGKIAYPVVVKPRWGSGSIGLEFAENERQLKLSFELIKEKLSSTILKDASLSDWDNAIMIQPKLKGDEYGLDVLNDFRGENVAVFVKRKIRMRAGETDMAETVNIPALAEIGKKIGKNLKHIGNLDCDVFFDGETACILEMNPRFGGGYPFTHCAGGDATKAYLAWARGNDAPKECFENFRAGETFSKCDRLIRVK
ncbi:MAG: ATP-grasp domain-containing protein [Opitutales bacterium]|nr:ATP-grasp domain-containing protein [Opitutales bacterium]